MTELKTLKEFPRYIPTPEELNYGDKYLASQDLKKEAIKWIGVLESVKLNPNNKPTTNHWNIDGLEGTECDCYDEFQTDSETMIKWIKHFFNITEKELKQ